MYSKLCTICFILIFFPISAFAQECSPEAKAQHDQCVSECATGFPECSSETSPEQALFEKFQAEIASCSGENAEATSYSPSQWNAVKRILKSFTKLGIGSNADIKALRKAVKNCKKKKKDKGNKGNKGGNDDGEEEGS